VTGEGTSEDGSTMQEEEGSMKHIPDVANTFHSHTLSDAFFVCLRKLLVEGIQISTVFKVIILRE